MELSSRSTILQLAITIGRGEETNLIPEEARTQGEVTSLGREDQIQLLSLEKVCLSMLTKMGMLISVFMGEDRTSILRNSTILRIAQITVRIRGLI